MKIRILHIVPNLFTGGIETMLYNYYSNIDKEKMEFVFASHGINGQIADKLKRAGCELWYITPRKKNIIKYFIDIIRIIFSRHWDIIHVHQNFSSIIPLFIARLANVKNRIAHAHGSRLQNGRFRRCIETIGITCLKLLATSFMACGKEAGTWLFGKTAVGHGQVTILRNALNLGYFHYSEVTKERMRNVLNIKEDYVIAHIARMTYEKNHTFSVKVLSGPLKLNSSVRLLFIGDGPLMKGIKLLANTCNVNENISFLGNIENVAEVLSAVDVLLLPSFHEGLPLTPIEAQATGVCCVLSDKVPRETAITDLVVFLSLRLGPKEWASKINGLMKYNKIDKSKEIRDAEYDIVYEAKKLEEFYFRLCS